MLRVLCVRVCSRVPSCSQGLAIVDAGGVTPLVTLLNEGDNRGKQFAATALSRLAACNEAASTEIAKAHAIVSLVGLLSGANGDAAQEAAAAALFSLAELVDNRVAITDAGGVGPLVTLLGSDHASTQMHAKGVLVRLSIESANRALIITKLVDMLNASDSSAGDSESAQEQAAAAIANLASESTENRVSIVDAGGIGPLIGLLEGGTPKAKENAIAAISKLAESDNIQKKIAQAGGVPLLVNTLASSTNAKELMQYAQLYTLAADALSKFASRGKENQAQITDAGAIPSLVAILGAPLPDLQANAAECLGKLATNNSENQVAIARTGGEPASQGFR